MNCNLSLCYSKYANDRCCSRRLLFKRKQITPIMNQIVTLSLVKDDLLNFKSKLIYSDTDNSVLFRINLYCIYSTINYYC